LSDVSLCVTKRKPFDVLAERPSLRFGRLVWQKFEPLVRDFLAAALEAAEADAAVFARFALKSA
jgi:hypothetical protein